MAIDFGEINIEDNLTKKSLENQGVKPEITLENLGGIVEGLVVKGMNPNSFFEKLGKINQFLDVNEIPYGENKEVLTNLSSVLLDVDFIYLQPSNQHTFFETVDCLIRKINVDENSEKELSSLVSQLERVSIQSHKEFDEYLEAIDQEYHNEEVASKIANSKASDDDWSPTYEEYEKDELLSSNPEKHKILITEKEEKALTNLLGALVNVAELAEKHLFIKSLIYKTSVSTMASLVRVGLKADLVYNKVEDEYKTENTLRRSYYEIVKEGLDMYLRKPGNKITYTRDDKYNSISDWAHALNGVESDHSYKHFEPEPSLSKKLFGELSGKKKFGVALFEAFKSRKIASALDAVKEKLLGLGEKVEDYQATADADSRFIGSDGLANEIFQKFIDSDTENPKSVSNLISVCLDYSKGDFSQAMQLTGYVLKFITRSEEILAVNPDKIRENLRDEYSEFHSFNRMGKSEDDNHTPDNKFKAFANKLFPDKSERAKSIYYETSYLNRLGLPYHAADMVSLLDTFSPECVLLMMVGEYLLYGTEHGALKFLSDLRVASELYRIDSYAKKVATKNV